MKILPSGSSNVRGLVGGGYCQRTLTVITLMYVVSKKPKNQRTGYQYLSLTAQANNFRNSKYDRIGFIINTKWRNKIHMHSANNHNIHIEHQKNSLNKILSFPVKTLKNSEDLQYFHELVQDTEVLS